MDLQSDLYMDVSQVPQIQHVRKGTHQYPPLSLQISHFWFLISVNRTTIYLIAQAITFHRILSSILSQACTSHYGGYFLSGGLSVPFLLPLSQFLTSTFLSYDSYKDFLANLSLPRAPTPAISSSHQWWKGWFKTYLLKVYSMVSPHFQNKIQAP